MVGVLPETGTPWDRAVLVPIESIWAMHDNKIAQEPPQLEQWLLQKNVDALPGFSAIVVKPVSISDAY